MTQLDDALTTALEARADTTHGQALSPATIRAAVHRQRTRSRVTTALVLMLVLLPSAGFVLGQRAESQSTTAQTRTVHRSGTVASLPWSGSTSLSLRKGSPDGRVHGWSLCFGESCLPLAAPAAHSLSLVDGATTVQGLAPLGTARVTVAVGDGPPVDAALSTAASADAPGVLFAAPDVVVSRPEGSAFSLSYTVSAFDSEGAQVAARRAVGGWDLASQHPANGAALVISRGNPPGPSIVAWADTSGWVCWGERAGVATEPNFGAYSCTPPDRPGELALVTDDLSDGVVLVRVPASVVTAEIADAQGHSVAKAVVRTVGVDRVALMDRRAAGPKPGWTVRGLDRAGRVVVQVPTGSLQPLDGTVFSSS